MIAIPDEMPEAPAVIASTLTDAVISASASFVFSEAHEGVSVSEKVGRDDVIVRTSPIPRRSVIYSVKIMLLGVAPATRIEGMTPTHASDDVVVYPAISTLRTVDFEDTALNNKVLAEDGFSARPPVHVTVLAPVATLLLVVIVKTFPLTPAALLLIVPLEETHTGGDDALGSQIDALAVIFIQSFDKRASVTPIENTTAVGATPAFKLPVAVTDELHVNALVVVYPTCPAIEVTDFEDTALNVTVVDDDGFAAKNAPEHVIAVAPAPMPALPTVIVSVVVVSVELALIAFAIPAMLHVGAFAGAKTAVEAVIVTESALISASLTPMWNCIWVIISPAKRLP